MTTYYLYVFNPMCLYKEPVVEKAFRCKSLADAKRELEKINEAAMRRYEELFPGGFHQETYISESYWWRDPMICKREWEITDGVAAWYGPWEECAPDDALSPKKCRAKRDAWLKECAA